MSEKQKQVTEQREQMRTRSQSAESRRNSTKGQVEKERKAVLQLLLEKTGLKYKWKSRATLTPEGKATMTP